MFDLFQSHRRAKLRSEPMPDAWHAILETNVPYISRMTAEELHTFEALVRIFLAEKSFEGCGGLVLTDEIKVTIAGQACVLLLHRDGDIYPDLDSILVYPHAYRAHVKKRDGIVVLETDDERLGESWSRGTLIVAWDHVRSATHHIAVGHNVVFHEFAHQLDAADGEMDGAPDLGSRDRYSRWARVLGDEFKDLTDRLHAGRGSDIDAYGATSAPEFFAVITEMFFESPSAMRAQHPELYAELAAFYKQDPAGRVDDA